MLLLSLGGFKKIHFVTRTMKNLILSLVRTMRSMPYGVVLPTKVQTLEIEHATGKMWPIFTSWAVQNSDPSNDILSHHLT